MHNEQMNFVRRVRDRFPKHFDRTNVLEVGSLNVNGSVRDLFRQPTLYLGLDLGPGPGVDHVCHGADFQGGPAAGWDVVISCEAFEHDHRAAQTFQNMISLTRPGGLVVVTCATVGREEHGTAKHNPGCSPHTLNFYGNVQPTQLINGAVLWRWDGWSVEVNNQDHYLYFWGVKA
jgi:SAM-dependent methyltransferase